MLPQVEDVDPYWTQDRPALLASISEVATSQGDVALAHRPVFQEDELYRSRPLILVASAVQNPGNLGALMRVAEAGEKFELQEFLDELIEGFSHGMKQRTVIAISVILGRAVSRPSNESPKRTVSTFSRSGSLSSRSLWSEMDRVSSRLMPLRSHSFAAQATWRSTEEPFR